ncbi:hypothetical protein E2P81_ATG01960 [Venturia nashicola]|uniref:Uncharacterized protein n=1 Tax=Venturia nashicola TaxID=86259 RepID=A0A4Z1P2C2_9PEZI|nr:hypothetical protein E6O75_ATG02001 [Venturia nashicola]TLD35657.1 hypothetical protein E2P81_ATG01960 [Venturia nashicola]
MHPTHEFGWSAFDSFAQLTRSHIDQTLNPPTLPQNWPSLHLTHVAGPAKSVMCTTTFSNRWELEVKQVLFEFLLALISDPFLCFFAATMVSLHAMGGKDRTLSSCPVEDDY